jgi:hypothetical protein
VAAPAGVTGLPRQLLRAEGFVLLSVALAAYFDGLDEPWWLVPVLLFVPDVSMAGYLGSTRLGAWCYDAGHSTIAPALLGAVAVAASSSLGEGLALVWLAHIGLDRALGYGLKYESGFADTHLGHIGH